MAKPRIFVSSTYYDLKHLRSALESFIDGLGYEPVLSEKGSIAYAPDLALDESCYREAQQADLMVLIVGGRYGSERSASEDKDESDFFSRYDSITRQEFRTAIEHKVPLYILIERAVYAEYQTYLNNQESIVINYAHVDSVNIFRMIEEILSLPRNNPVFAFDRFHEIESWLREQWSGLFRELIQRMSGQEQLETLAGQVSQLTEINRTLKRYLESLMSDVSPDKSEELIDSESKRLAELHRYRKIANNDFVDYVIDRDVSLVDVGEILMNAKTTHELFNQLKEKTDDEELKVMLNKFCTKEYDYVLNDINEVRLELGVERLTWPNAAAPKKKSPKKKAPKKKAPSGGGAGRK